MKTTYKTPEAAIQTAKFLHALTGNLHRIASNPGSYKLIPMAIALMLSACNIVQPDGTTSVIAQPEKKQVEANGFDNYTCWKTETGTNLDPRRKTQSWFDFETETHQFGVDFFTYSQNPSAQLMNDGFVVEFIDLNEQECHAETNLDRNPNTRLPIDADFLIVTGQCQTGIFTHPEDNDVEVENNHYNIDRSNYIIIPALDLVDDLEDHLTCSPL